MYFVSDTGTVDVIALGMTRSPVIIGLTSPHFHYNHFMLLKTPITN